jgi:D-tyrosyl-tRNA(Tyr) deacylase
MTNAHAGNKDVRFRLVVQRVSQAELTIDGTSRGRMEHGLVVLFGVAAEKNGDELGPRRLDEQRDRDIIAVLDKLSDKLVGLRIFADSEGKMNLSVRDVTGSLYLVSQFTLFADCKKGYRPGFSAAAKPPFALEVYDKFVDLVKAKVGGLSVYTGEFAADMKVCLVNDGPVTIVIDADSEGILG